MTEQNQESSSVSSSYSEITSSSSSAIDISDLYRYYESKELGVSFYAPAVYAFPRTITGGIMEFNNSHIVYNTFFVADSDTGEPASISFTKTSDPTMLTFLSQYHPLENIVVNGTKMQKYHEDAVGSPEGFIQKIKGGYLIIEFNFTPGEQEMERVLGSMKLF